MKLAIVGYGRMGRLVDLLASDAGFEVVARLNETPKTLPSTDVAIEFSTPETALLNIESLAALGVNTVSGTTGWFEGLERATEIVQRAGTALVYGANFSVGAALFSKVAREAARLLAPEGGYEAWAWEQHHAEKKDAPSGTLLHLIGEMKRAGYARRIDVSSSRAGYVPGTHEIGFDSGDDTITLRHTARSREGFAQGALRSAQWVTGKKGVFEFKDTV